MSDQEGKGLQRRLAKVKNRKGPESLEILPEMVKMGMNNGEFVDLLAT